VSVNEGEPIVAKAACRQSSSNKHAAIVFPLRSSAAAARKSTNLRDRNLRAKF
jgi:hypothetical protein